MDSTEDKESLCMYCVNTCPVENINDLFPGAHIKIGRRNLLKAISKPILSKLSEEKQKKLKNLDWGYLYYHHAIVVKVDKDNQEVTLIHFNGNTMNGNAKSFLPGGCKANIRKEKKKFEDLKHVFLLKDSKNSFSSEDVVNRAKSMLKLSQESNDKASDGVKYHVFQNNCENLANLIKSKSNLSSQVMRTKDNAFCLPKVFNNLLLITLKLDDTQITDLMKIIFKKIGKLKIGNSILILTLALTILMTCFEMYRHYKNFQKGIICLNCFKQNIFKSALIALFSTAIAVPFFFLTPGLNGIIISLVASLVFTIAVYFLFRPVYRNINAILDPGHAAEQVRILSNDILSPGNIICFKYYGLYHDAVVTKVNENIKMAIEYIDWDTINGYKLQVEEKEIKDEIERHNGVGFNRKELEVTCSGKDILHFCKIPFNCNFTKDEIENLSINELETILRDNGVYPFTAVHMTWNQLKKRIENFRQFSEKICFKDSVIKTETVDHDVGKIMKINGLRQIDSETDVNYPRVSHILMILKNRFVSERIKFHTLNHGNQLRKLKTEQMCDILEKNGMGYRRNASHRELQQLVIHLRSRFSADLSHGIWKNVKAGDIRQGDIVHIEVNGIKRKAFVKSVKQDVEFVHYGLKSLSSKREVLKESKAFNFKNDIVYKYDYSSFSTEEMYNPAEVVENANSRVGERLWHAFKNRSSHLAHGCILRKS